MGVVSALQLREDATETSPDAAAYFRAFDQDSSGVVHSREYLCGVACLDSPVCLLTLSLNCPTRTVLILSLTSNPKPDPNLNISI